QTWAQTGLNAGAKVGCGRALCALLAAPAAVALFCLAARGVEPAALARAQAQSVVVLDREDRLLRAYTTDRGRWRLPIDPAGVDQRSLALVIALEDKRFYAHHGVDAGAIGRALWQLARHRRIVSGGSTLTMQVARLVAAKHERSVLGKLRQALGALALERRLS